MMGLRRKTHHAMDVYIASVNEFWFGSGQERGDTPRRDQDGARAAAWVFASPVRLKRRQARAWCGRHRPGVARAATHGFSLIELVAAMAIFSMGVLACLELYSISLRSANDNLLYTQAVFLAEGLMEETMVDGYLYAGTDSGDFGTNYPDHAWEMEIADMAQEGLTEVTLVVQWRVRGKEKTFTLVSLCSDRDISEPLL